VTILDPEQIKDIFNKIYDFPKPDINPLLKLLATGLADYEGEKWSKHRRLINPAFNLEKLKVSCLHLLDMDLCYALKHIRKKLRNCVCTCMCLFSSPLTRKNVLSLEMQHRFGKQHIL